METKIRAMANIVVERINTANKTRFAITKQSIEKGSFGYSAYFTIGKIFDTEVGLEMKLSKTLIIESCWVCISDGKVSIDKELSKYFYKGIRGNE